MAICLYGKAKSGWVIVRIRRTNGMVAFTPRLNDSWWIDLPMIWYISQRRFSKKKSYETTLLITLKRRVVFGFG